MINTPRGLGFALVWNAGMANIMVQCTSNTNCVNGDQLVDDFTVLDINDSDDDSDYEPEESDSDDIVSGWNITDIEKRTYGIPIDTKYQQNMFLTNVNTQRIMELGLMVRKGHHFSRKDQTRKNLIQNSSERCIGMCVEICTCKNYGR